MKAFVTVYKALCNFLRDVSVYTLRSRNKCFFVYDLNIFGGILIGRSICEVVYAYA